MNIEQRKRRLSCTHIWCLFFLFGNWCMVWMTAVVLLSL